LSTQDRIELLNYSQFHEITICVLIAYGYFAYAFVEESALHGAMIIVSAQTASAMAPHTGERAWIMFVLVTPPNGGIGPILIEPVRGQQIAARLGELARDNAYDTFMIGLIETTAPEETASAIRAQYATKQLHHNWYESTADLLAYIQHVAQGPIRQLLEQTHPGAMSQAMVGLEELMQILGMSESTIRRMVKAEEIPFMRFGRVLRFVPAEVIASLQHRTDGRR
jgi:excisionase family DNA binding protein